MILHSGFYASKNCRWTEQQNHYKLDLLRKLNCCVHIYLKCNRYSLLVIFDLVVYESYLHVPLLGK